jgi:outer membrane protein TolC
MFGNDFSGYSVGFSLDIPLSNKSAQAEYSNAMNGKRTAEAQIATLAQSIALEVRNAHSQVEMNRARIQAATKAKELAIRQLDAEQRKFQLGVSEVRFVLQEQQNVTAAETNEILALVNYTKALVNYDKALGRTLQRNNVQIEQQLAGVQTSGRRSGN